MPETVIDPTCQEHIGGCAYGSCNAPRTTQGCGGCCGCLGGCQVAWERTQPVSLRHPDRHPDLSWGDLTTKDFTL